MIISRKNTEEPKAKVAQRHILQYYKL